MIWVAASLVGVGVLALLGAVFGLAVGLSSNLAAGVEGRPAIYWLIAASFLVISTLFWPVLLSWYVDLALPAWHRKAITPTGDKGRFEDVRSGRRVLAMARATEPHRRASLAWRALGYGSFYVVLSIPMPLAFGVAAIRPGPLQPEEALPLIAALVGPVIITAMLLTRSKRPPG